MKKILTPILLGILAISVASVGFVYATEDSSGTSTTTTSQTTAQRHIEVVEMPNMVLVRSDYSSGALTLLFRTFP